MNPMVYAGLDAPTPENIEISFGRILSAVCNAHGVDEKAVLSNSRKREYAYARFNFCYLARVRTNASLIKIAEFMGRTHATAINGIKQHNSLIAYKDYRTLAENTLKGMRCEDIVGVADSNVKPKPKTAKDYEEFKLRAINAVASYSLLEPHEFMSFRATRGDRADEVNKYVYILRNIINEKTQNASITAELLGVDRDCIYRANRWRKTVLPERRDILFDYHKIKAML